MLKQEKKSQVLAVLQQKKASVSLIELLDALGTNYAERTVRRWLDQLAQEGLVIKTGQKRGMRYASVQSPVYQEQPLIPQDNLLAHISFSKSSQKIIVRVRQPIFTRDPVTYQQNWFNRYEPNKTFYFSTVQRKALFISGQQTKIHEPAGTYARRIYNRLLIDLSYNSSRLEGNTYSLLETQRLVLEGVAVQDKLNEEKVMILNHKEAIRHLVETSHRLTVNFNEICTLHYLLSEGLVVPGQAGKIRQEGVRIGASTYMPMEGQARLEQQLKKICSKAAVIQHPFEQSLFLLTHIAYLQAFIDVNKRTARLSSNIPLISNNLIPLSFNEINQDDYLSAMIAIYECNDVGPLAELYFWCYERTCKYYRIAAESVGFDAVRVRYRMERRATISYIVTHQLSGKKAQAYIKSFAQKKISPTDRALFIEDIAEDLQVLALPNIAGMGITAKQLKDWLALK